MKLIKAIVRPNMVDNIKEALGKLNMAGMTVTEVRGHGRQKGHTAVYRGREYEVSLLPKMEIEVVIPDSYVEDVIKAIIGAARTGEIGDGRVFVLPVEQGYNIRTGEKDVSTPSDLFLSPDLTEDEAQAYLRSLGFRDPAGTDQRLQAMAADTVVREALARIAGELLPALAEAADPDAAAAGLGDYLAARAGPVMFLQYLGEDPRAMHALTCVFGSSPPLSEILIHNPEYFHWLVPQIERGAPDRQDLEDELDTMLATSGGRVDTFEVIRRWKEREILRIGACDLLRRETVPSIAGQLSDLADVIVARALALATSTDHIDDVPGTFAVIALGRLGGREMSYEAELELMYVFDAPEGQDRRAREHFQRLGARLTAMLRADDSHPDDPFYRTADVVFQSLSDSRAYHASRGGMADRLVLLKARPVAGDADLGRRFLEAVRPWVYQDVTDPSPSHPALSPDCDDRDAVNCVEACIQSLQLRHGARYPVVQQAGTLDALNRMAAEGLVAERDRRDLAHAYEFLKAATHRRELMPGDLGAASEHFEKQVRSYHASVVEIHRKLIIGPTS